MRRARQRYARGDLATAMCPVCGFVVGYRELVKDWRGVWVCGDCRDVPPPKPVTIHPDAQALHHPRPWLHLYPPAPRVEDQIPVPQNDRPNFFVEDEPPFPAHMDGGPPADGGDYLLDGGPPLMGGDMILDGGSIVVPLIPSLLDGGGAPAEADIVIDGGTATIVPEAILDAGAA